VAAVASLAGLPIQDVLQEHRALQIERAGLPQAVEDLTTRTLPDGAGMHFQHDGSVLSLHVTWPERESGGSYRELALPRALAGHAGPMQPGGADRLVDRVNVDRVTLEARRGDQTLASMDWPQSGLERGAQALEIDYEAAGLSPLPDQMDLDGLLRSLPARVRTGDLCSRALSNRVWIGHCVETTSPAIPPGGSLHRTGLEREQHPDSGTQPGLPGDPCVSGGVGGVRPGHSAGCRDCVVRRA
jgi:hypothetical protein